MTRRELYGAYLRSYMSLPTSTDDSMESYYARAMGSHMARGGHAPLGLQEFDEVCKRALDGEERHLIDLIDGRGATVRVQIFGNKPPPGRYEIA